MEPLTSFQNPKIKLIKQLRDKRTREETRLFVVDDGRDLARALSSSFEVEFALFCPELASGEDKQLLEQIPSNRIYQVPQALLEKVSYREGAGAWVVVFRQPSLADYRNLSPTSAPLILALVNLQKPGNIGALMRTADAAGFSAVFLVDTLLDIYNPNIIRSSTGASFLRNVYALSTEHALEYLQQQRYEIASAYVDGAENLYNIRFSQHLAVVLGTEDQGLPPIWGQCAQHRLRIPMQGQLADSLNVSVSGAVIMYEILRQRLTNA